MKCHMAFTKYHMQCHMTLIMQDCVREGVAVTALSVPEEDLPEVNGELGNRRVNDKWPLSYAVINSTLIICRTIIGVSLSKPHTSGTALRRCMCIQPCLWPYTINFKCAFKYFPKIERPCPLAWQCWATAKVQRWQP